MRRPLLLAALLALPGALAAQTHPLVGTWDVQVPAGLEVSPEGATQTMAKGTFTFTVVGDSIIGTLKTEPVWGGAERPARRVAAKLVTGAVTFVYKRESRMVLGGEATDRTSTSTYRFEVDGDKLQGTLDRKIEGLTLDMGGPQPITGTRARS